MSDLSREILAWHQNLTQNVGIAEDDVAELESHLLDEIEVLQSSGLRADEAFIIASRRLGHPRELAVEYAKNDMLMSWRHPAKLVLWGLLLQRVASLIWVGILTVFSYFGLWILFQGSWLTYLYSSTVLAQWSVLGVLWLLAEDPQGSIARNLVRLETAVRGPRGAIGLILGTIALDVAIVVASLLRIWVFDINAGLGDTWGWTQMFLNLIVTQLAWSIPVATLLLVLIWTKPRSIAKYSLR